MWVVRAVLRRFWVAALLAGLVAGLVAPPAASAQDKAFVEKLNELDRQALADYAAEDFESARLGLREAITLAGRGGLGSDPIMAHLWADLGALYINGLRDKAKGEKALGIALRIDPETKPSESMMTPEVRSLISALTGKPVAPPTAVPAPPASPGTLPGAAPPPVAPPVPGAAAPANEAAAAAPPPPKPAPPRRKRGTGTEPDLPAEIPQPLYCPNADEAPPGQDVVLNCVLAPDIESKKVVLFYRSAGAEQWLSSPTQISELGWIRAVIPGAAMSGKSVQYYLDARDVADKSVAKAGRDDSPNLLLVREEATSLSGGLWAGMQGRRDDSQSSDDSLSDEDPLIAVARQREAERAAAGIHRRRKGAFYVGLSVGSGYGWHPKQRLEFYDDAEIAEGYIPSGLVHLAPAIGYHILDQLAVSIEGRVQFIPQNGSGDGRPGAPARGAFLILGRAQYFLGAGNLQGSASLLAGIGDGFRLTIGPQSDVYRRNDSVRGGPFVIGAGLGALYHFSSHLALVADFRVLSGHPNQAFVGDFSGGLNVAF